MPRRVFIFLKKTGNSVSYLPHRQLRNARAAQIFGEFRYLPHRQLRNVRWAVMKVMACYLPHRQLRNTVDVG